MDRRAEPIALTEVREGFTQEVAPDESQRTPEAATRGALFTRR